MTFAARAHRFGKVGVAEFAAQYVLEGTWPGLKPEVSGFRLTTGGSVQEKEYPNTSYVFSDTWLVEGSAPDFEVYMSHNSGDTWTSGTVDTWLPMNTARTWEITVVQGTMKTGSYTLQIRDKYSQEIHDTCTVSFNIDNL